MSQHRLPTSQGPKPTCWGPKIATAWLLILGLSLPLPPFILAAQADAEPEAAASAPWERQPYRIRMLAAFQDDPAFTAQFRRRLCQRTAQLAQQIVGAPWQLEAQPAPHALTLQWNDTPQTIAVDPSRPYFKDADKLVVAMVRRSGGGFEIRVQELDVATQLWGSPRKATVADRAVLDRALLQLCLDRFAPLAELEQLQGREIVLRVKGGELVPNDPALALVRLEDVFVLVRQFLDSNGKLESATVVDWTYLNVQSVEGARVRCGIWSAHRAPATQRAPRSRLVALAARPGSQPIRIRLVSDTSDQPLAGYEVRVTDTLHGRELLRATTDLDGRVEIPAWRSGLRILELQSGRETLLRLPVLPGTLPEEATVPLRPDEARLQVEARLVALEERLMDELARRTLLLRHIRHLIDQGAHDQAQEALDRIDRATQDRFRQQLHDVRTLAHRLEKKRPDESLDPKIERLLSQTQELIEHHLSQEPLLDLAEELAISRQQADTQK